LTAHADKFIAPLYFTAYNGNVFKANVSYNDNDFHFRIGPVKTITTLPTVDDIASADGIAFTADGQLAVAGAGRAIYKVDQNSKPYPAPYTSQPSPTPADHMMVAPDGTIYASVTRGYHQGGFGLSSFDPKLSGPGTAHPISGRESPKGISTLAWTTNDSTHAFYTSSGPNGIGDFGTIDMTDPNNFHTTRLMKKLPAAHGMAYDPWTRTLILMGAQHITQIDPNNPTVILSDLDLSNPNLPDLYFDQGNVDGQGHIYAASNDGTLVFLDIRRSGLVANPDFVAEKFLAYDLDDVAPLVGPGARPAPEPSSLAILAVSSLGLLGFGWRRRRAE
jgi:hypothetical protein